MNRTRTTLTLAALAAAGLAAATPAAAQVVYSNVTTYTFNILGFNKAAAGGTGPTTVIADDITALSGFAGRQVTQFTYGVSNFNSTTVTFTPSVYFYSANGANGGPGTLIASLTLSPVTQSPGGSTLYTQSSAAGFFALPAGTFWAGLAFSGAPAAQLTQIGLPVYNPPTVGTSQDRIFLSADPATATSNPAGSLFSSGSTPPYNLGWAFTVAAPEPSAFAALGVGILGVGALTLKARRRKAA